MVNKNNYTHGFDRDIQTNNSSSLMAADMYQVFITGDLQRNECY